MRILVVNDDGINAKGIYSLAKEFEKVHDVTVVAPDNQRSACGHSITLTSPIIIKEVDLEGLKSRAYSISGTPADCVRIGLDILAEGKVDMVISGINKGLNVGTDVVYSGTVSAAVEASIYGTPSMAVSLQVSEENENYEIAAKYALNILKMLENQLLGKDTTLNLNIPLCLEEEIKGIKICKLGKTTYEHKYIEYISEDGKGYNVKGNRNKKEFRDDDVDYIEQKYVTLTPLNFDLTNHEILSSMLTNI